MQIILNGNEYELDTLVLEVDLLRENLKLVTISKHGELVLDDLYYDETYPYRREVYQMREPGEGTSNVAWANHEWEFCRSIKMEPYNGN